MSLQVAEAIRRVGVVVVGLVCFSSNYVGMVSDVVACQDTGMGIQAEGVGSLGIVDDIRRLHNHHNASFPSRLLVVEAAVGLHMALMFGCAAVDNTVVGPVVA